MRSMLVGGDRMKSLPDIAITALMEFCENQRNCNFCPFQNEKYCCLLEDNRGDNPEDWEDCK